MRCVDEHCYVPADDVSPESCQHQHSIFEQPDWYSTKFDGVFNFSDRKASHEGGLRHARPSILLQARSTTRLQSQVQTTDVVFYQGAECHEHCGQEWARGPSLALMLGGEVSLVVPPSCFSVLSGLDWYGASPRRGGESHRRLGAGLIGLQQTTWWSCTPEGCTRSTFQLDIPDKGGDQSFSSAVTLPMGTAVFFTTV